MVKCSLIVIVTSKQLCAGSEDEGAEEEQGEVDEPMVSDHLGSEEALAERLKEAQAAFPKQGAILESACKVGYCLSNDVFFVLDCSLFYTMLLLVSCYLGIAMQATALGLEAQ